MDIYPYGLMSICPYVHMSLYPYVSMSICPYVYTSLCLYVPMSICPYVYMSLCSYVPISLRPYDPVSRSFCFYMSLYPFVPIFLCLFIIIIEDSILNTLYYKFIEKSQKNPVFFTFCSSGNPKMHKIPLSLGPSVQSFGKFYVFL